MFRDARRNDKGRFDEISSNRVNFHRFDELLVISSAEMTILTNVSQIRESEINMADLTILANLSQIRQSEISPAENNCISNLSCLFLPLSLIT